MKKRTNAFTEKKKEGTCYKCEKHGHFAQECQDGSQAGRNGGTWRGPTRGRGRGRVGRSSHGRGRGNFRQQGASTCEQSGEGANAWIATAHAAHSSEANRLRNNEIEWLLDSSCSDHIVNNENYFEKYIELKIW